MSPPALFVLFLALVSPILDTSMATDDFRKSKTADVVTYTYTNKKYKQINNDNLNMNKIRTNSDLLSDRNIENITTSNNLNNNKKISNILNIINTANKKDIEKKFREIHKSNLELVNNNYVSTRQYGVSKYADEDTFVVNERSKIQSLVKETANRRSKIYSLGEEKPNRRFKRQNLGDERVNRRSKRQIIADGRCDTFNYNQIAKKIEHPRDSGKKEGYYYNNTDCTTVISAKEGEIIGLTFVDVFHIEEHPDCAYDYLEIRDGANGYDRLLGKLCGDTFPAQLFSSGPDMWLKFHSDDTIEYEGFHINVEMIQSPNSHKVPSSCIQELSGHHDVFSNEKVDPDCLSKSTSQTLDVLWKIKTDDNTKIYLNFTHYKLKKPNNCEENFIQVFGSILEETAELNRFCGSVATMVSTKDEEGQEGNVMHVRMYASASARDLEFEAHFTAFRTLDPNKQQTCDPVEEFDCEDNTCINIQLRCNSYANCRLKTDEDPALCARAAESMINETHIMVILIIFSLILSGMSFVFLFKCIKKLYQDHKIIKEQIRQSCEDRLDDIGASRLTLDAKRLREDSEPRASLERDNHTNEMFKRQRSFPRQPTSIDSDFIQETQIDVDEEPWRREVESVIEREEVRVERNGRQRRSDMSKKEQSLRRESEREDREQKEIRDVSVGAPDTKESGCQTRESLFEVPAGSEGGNNGSGSGSGPGSAGFSTFGYSGDTLHRPPRPPGPTPRGVPSHYTASGGGNNGSGSGSGPGSAGFSTFGYSGDTLHRPTPPPGPRPPAVSHLTIQLGRHDSPQNNTQSKKVPDRRPMSNETTRSAPDVIIVSKPVR